MKKYLLFLVSAMVLFATQAFALPALQLGPGTGDPEWTFDPVEETWVFNGDQTTVNAYANATRDAGGNGGYAWLPGDADLYAYLVVSAMPQSDVLDGDVFDITVSNAVLDTFGWGTPPLSDANSLAPHGIYQTYFEIYEFQFDGAIGEISNVQPGNVGTGQGYTESFDITFNGSSLLDFAGLHFDLFTFDGNGQVFSFAPFSHDAAMKVPEPGTLGLVLVSFIIFGLIRRRMLSNI